MFFYVVLATNRPVDIFKGENGNDSACRVPAAFINVFVFCHSVLLYLKIAPSMDAKCVNGGDCACLVCGSLPF